METRILFLTDDPQELSFLQRALQLRADGWDLRFSDDLEDAWSRLGGESFDIVVCQARMKQNAGFGLLRRVRSEQSLRDTPVVVVMNKDDFAAKFEAAELGATDWLADPIDEHDFAFRMRNVLKVALYERHARAGDNRQEDPESEAKQSAATHLDLVLRLARAAEVREMLTGHHMIRVGRISRAIAKSLGHGEEFCQTIFLAAPLHDIGKIGVPDRVLLKDGQLTDDEWAQMQDHCKIGAAIIDDDAQLWEQLRKWGEIPKESGPRRSLDPVIQMARTICLTHHEKWDGTGYPEGLEGEEIPTESRIVAVADVYDALRSERNYKSEFSVEQTLKDLEDRVGSHFDPQVHAAFVESLDTIREIERSHATQMDAPGTPAGQSVS